MKSENMPVKPSTKEVNRRLGRIYKLALMAYQRIHPQASSPEVDYETGNRASQSQHD